MRVLILDGHPAPERLIGTLLDVYQAALPVGAEIERIAVRGLSFSPNLAAGYAADQPWEPDLRRVGDALAAADHLVVAFPLWWGAEPALLKGLLDRVVLPGFAFRYHRDNPFWDRLLAGRSADVIVTMDTPPWYLRLVYGDPVMRRWRIQVLGFCGFKPIRVHRIGPTRRGGTQKSLPVWERRLRRAAAGVGVLRRGVKTSITHDHAGFTQAVADRKS